MPKPTPKPRPNSYPFGSSLKTRAFSAGIGFRFGFNTQEKDQEAYNNNETYTATFWEYDGRLGRRWNVDPVRKSWQSNYSCISNSPMWKLDLHGDDDFFDANGNYSHSTKTGTQIKIKNANGNLLYSELPLKSVHDKAVVASIAQYYAKKAGIASSINVATRPEDEKNASNSMAFTTRGVISITIQESGKISSSLNDFNNLISVLFHEKIHQDIQLNNIKLKKQQNTDELEHVNIYIKQIKNPIFKNTTSDFKKKIAINSAELLTDAANKLAIIPNYDLTTVEKKISEFNKNSTLTQYSLIINQTHRKDFDADEDKYKVYIKPIPKLKTK